MQAKLPSRQNSMRASGTGLASSAGSVGSAGVNTGTSSLKSGSGTPFEAMNRNKDSSGGILEAWLLIEYCDRGSLQASRTFHLLIVQKWHGFTRSGYTLIQYERAALSSD